MKYDLRAIQKYFSDKRQSIKNTGLVFLTAGVMTLTGCGNTYNYEDGKFIEKPKILISKYDIKGYEVSHYNKEIPENGIRIAMEFPIN